MYTATAIAMIVGTRGHVGDGADVLHHGGEADDGRHEAEAPTPGGLREELVPPVVVDAVGGRLRGHARAEVRADQLLQHDRQRHRDEQRRQPHADDQPRRALDAIQPVETRTQWPDGLMA